MKKETLQVDIREITTPVEKPISTAEITEVPTEGKWFRVDPLAIDQNLFKEKREDFQQEKTRRLILEAFKQMKKNHRYTKPFKTMFPKKTWEAKPIKELLEMAKNLGDHNADWVEQALEWAQRISRGENWEDICNKQDTVFDCRLIEWQYGHCKYVGGFHKYPATYIDRDQYHTSHISLWAVPLVVSYEE